MRFVDQLALLREGARMGARQVARRFGGRGPARFAGTPSEICRRVVAACWTGTYFRAGTANYDQFWIRDFAISLQGLLDLGYRQQARECLTWALEHYEKAGHIATTIFPGKQAVDIYTYSSDSLPFVLYALEKLDAEDLRKRFRTLLTREISLYYIKVFDSKAGRPRGDRMFSSVKDTMEFTGTCYTHTMVTWLGELLSRAQELPNPYRRFKLREKLIEQFWTGEFFKNDAFTDPPLCSGDANFWPFWCGIVDNPKEKLKQSVEAVQKAGLDKPFPLKYHPERFPDLELAAQRAVIPNYQGDAIWTFFTPLWIELIGDVDPEAASGYIARYNDLLAEYGTWVEVFSPDGSGPLKGRFGYGSDSGMLWAANWPRVAEKFGPGEVPVREEASPVEESPSETSRAEAPTNSGA